MTFQVLEEFLLSEVQFYLLAYKLYSEVAGDENLHRVKNHPRMSSIVIMAGLRTWKKHIYDIGLSWMKIYNV